MEPLTDWLEKRPGKAHFLGMKPWQKRLVVWESGVLQYYKSEAEQRASKSAGTITVTSIAQRAQEMDLHTADRVYFFRCPSDAVCERWCVALRAHIEQVHTQTTRPASAPPLLSSPLLSAPPSSSSSSSASSASSSSAAASPPTAEDDVRGVRGGKGGHTESLFFSEKAGKGKGKGRGGHNNHPNHPNHPNQSEEIATMPSSFSVDSPEGTHTSSLHKLNTAHFTIQY